MELLIALPSCRRLACLPSHHPHCDNSCTLVSEIQPSTSLAIYSRVWDQRGVRSERTCLKRSCLKLSSASFHRWAFTSMTVLESNSYLNYFISSQGWLKFHQQKNLGSQRKLRCHITLSKSQKRYPWHRCPWTFIFNTTSTQIVKTESYQVIS